MTTSASSARLYRSTIVEGQTRVFEISDFPSRPDYFIYATAGGSFSAEAGDFAVSTNDQLGRPQAVVVDGDGARAYPDALSGRIRFEVAATDYSGSSDDQTGDETFGVRLCTTVNCQGGTVLGDWTVAITESAANHAVSGAMGATVTVHGGAAVSVMEVTRNGDNRDKQATFEITLSSQPLADIVIVAKADTEVLSGHHDDGTAFMSPIARVSGALSRDNAPPTVDGQTNQAYDPTEAEYVVGHWYSAATITSINNSRDPMDPSPPLVYQASKTITVVANDNLIDSPGGAIGGNLVFRVLNDAAAYRDATPGNATAFSGVTIPNVPIAVTGDDEATKVRNMAAATEDNIATEGSTTDTAKFRIRLARELVAGEEITVPLRFSGATLNTNFSLGLDSSANNPGATYADSTDGAQGRLTLAGAGAQEATLEVTALGDSDSVGHNLRVFIPQYSDPWHTNHFATDLSGGACAGVACDDYDQDTDKRGYGITLREASPGLTIIDNGTGRFEENTRYAYRIRLNTQPTHNVTVEVVYRSLAASTGQGSLTHNYTFTPTTWAMPQEVTINPSGDGEDEPDQTVTVTHSFTSSDNTYNSLPTVTHDLVAVDTAATGVTMRGPVRRSESDTDISKVMVEGDATRVDRSLTISLDRALVEGEFARIPLMLEAKGHSNTDGEECDLTSGSGSPDGDPYCDSVEGFRGPRLSANVAWPTHYNDFVMTATGTGVSLSAVNRRTENHVGYRYLEFRGAGAREAAIEMHARDGFDDGENHDEVFTIRLAPEWQRLDEDNPAYLAPVSNLGGGVSAGTSHQVAWFGIEDTSESEPSGSGAAIANAEADEGSPVTFTVTIPDAAPSGGVTVDYSISDGLGYSGLPAYSIATTADYTGSGTTGSVTIVQGQTSNTISVPTTSDSDYEGDHYFRVTLTGTSGPNASAVSVHPSRNVAVGTINDDDDLTDIQFNEASAAKTAAEGDGTVELTVRRFGPGPSLAVPASVYWTTADGTGAGGAAHPDDYTADSGYLLFPAGERFATITVHLVDDDTLENAETFKVQLSQPVDARIGARGEATITLNDDDAGVIVSPQDLWVLENGTAQYTIALNTEPTADVALSLTAAGPNSAAASVSPASHTFTAGGSGNWGMPLTVTVTGADEPNQHRNRPDFQVSHSFSSSDSDYGSSQDFSKAVPVYDAPEVEAWDGWARATGARVVLERPHTVSSTPGIWPRVDFAPGLVSYVIRLSNRPEPGGTVSVTATPNSTDLQLSLRPTGGWSNSLTVTFGDGYAAGSATSNMAACNNSHRYRGASETGEAYDNTPATSWECWRKVWVRRVATNHRCTDITHTASGGGIRSRAIETLRAFSPLRAHLRNPCARLTPAAEPARNSPSTAAAIEVPDTAVSNLQAAVVDSVSASASWNSVEHATGYEIEWDALDADSQSVAAGVHTGVTDTTATIEHHAPAAVLLTVTVTPEYVDENNDTHTLTDLAATATLNLTPQTAQADSIQTSQCTVTLPPDAVTVGEVKAWRGGYSHDAHVTRWNRVLAALGESTGETAMTAADALTIKNRFDNTRWDRTHRTLAALQQCPAPDPQPQPAPEPEPESEPEPVCTVTLPPDAVTVEEVKAWRGDYSHDAHVARWNGVLAALGENSGETAMTAADALTIKNRFDNTRWDRTHRTLAALQQCSP